MLYPIPKIFKSVLLIVFASVIGTNVRAQENVTAATLGGVVQDQNSAVIVGVSITVTNTAQNLVYTSTTDDKGRYHFPYLPVGGYELKFEQNGFRPYRQKLNLTVGQMIDLPVMLYPAAADIQISITPDIVVVETVRTQASDTILPKDVTQLPLNGRNYLDLALLVPAVSLTNTGNNDRFAETSAVPGTGISTAGQRNLANTFLLDGLSANDDAADLAGSFYSQEVIREFQVITSGGSTQFGRSAGGIVNIITQSGTNDWHSRGYGFFRNQRFDARNAFALTRDPLTQGQYGGSLGGPIKHDRTFLFTNFEQTRLNRAGIVSISAANVVAINARLNAVNFPGPRISTGEFPTGYDTTNYFARVDHRINDANLLTARYSIYDINSINARNVGSLNAISRGTALTDRDQTIAVNEVATLSTNVVNEARFQYTHSRLAAPINDNIGPAVSISGIATFGASSTSPTARNADLIELVDSISNQRGAHALKGGIDFLYNRVNIVFPSSNLGSYTFSSLANFNSGVYTQFQQAFGPAGQFQTNPNLGLFIQDEWRATQKLTINAGLRYDVQWLDGGVNTDKNNFAPRLGLAYSADNGKTVVRANFGIYYDRIPLRALSNALQRDGAKFKVAVVSPIQPGAPIFPNVLSAFPSTILTAITRINPDIEDGYSEQANLQVERDLGRNTSLTVGYQHLRGLHVILSHNVNVPTLTAAQAALLGIPNLGRPDPNFANISQFESAGDSYYNAMTVALNKRATRWATFRFSYTLAKAIDDTGNFFFSTPQDNFNFLADRGLSDNDQRHRIALSGTLEMPQGLYDSRIRKAIDHWQLGYIFTYASAYPFNIVTGNDRNNDTTVNDRPVGVGRNTGKTFPYSSLDLRLGRTWKMTEHLNLETLIEGFNVLNHTNLQFPNATFGTGTTPLPAFGLATAARDGRQLQFGLRLSF